MREYSPSPHMPADGPVTEPPLLIVNSATKLSHVSVILDLIC